MVQTSWVWLPWVLIVTGLALGGAWFSWRRGRRGSAVRWIGVAVAPVAAYLLGLIALGFRVIDAFADWSARFVFNPAAWVGLGLALVSVALITGGSRLGTRLDSEPAKAAPRRQRASAPKPVAGSSGTGDPELDEIDAILKRRGID